MSPEMLAVLPSASVQDVFSRPQFTTDQAVVDNALSVLGGAEVLAREHAETRTSVRQAVAYTTMRWQDRLLCLRRSSSNREELDGRWTIVFGGHVEQGENDGLAGLRRCLHRELDEEFGDLLMLEPRFLGLVADPSTVVGSRHLGFMFEVELQAARVRLDRRFDNWEYSRVPRQPRFFPVTSLLRADTARFDPWSRLVLDAYR